MFHEKEFPDALARILLRKVVSVRRVFETHATTRSLHIYIVPSAVNELRIETFPISPNNHQDRFSSENARLMLRLRESLLLLLLCVCVCVNNQTIDDFINYTFGYILRV